MRIQVQNWFPVPITRRMRLIAIATIAGILVVVALVVLAANTDAAPCMMGLPGEKGDKGDPGINGVNGTCPASCVGSGSGGGAQNSTFANGIKVFGTATLQSVTAASIVDSGALTANSLTITGATIAAGNSNFATTGTVGGGAITGTSLSAGSGTLTAGTATLSGNIAFSADATSDIGTKAKRARGIYAKYLHLNNTADGAPSVIAGAVSVNTLSVTNTLSSSTTPASNAVQVTGGAHIQADLMVGGTSVLSGPATFSSGFLSSASSQINGNLVVTSLTVSAGVPPSNFALIGVTNTLTLTSTSNLYFGFSHEASPTSFYYDSGLMYTPGTSGVLLVSVSGSVSSAAPSGILHLAYGTGTPPTPAQSAIGANYVPASQVLVETGSNSALLFPFGYTSVVTLTVGTLYWFDFTGSITGTGNVAVAAPTITIVEF